MKNPNLTRKIEHYKASENRRWKRIWNTCALVYLMITCGVCVVVVQYYGNGKSFQLAFQLFTASLLVCIAALVPPMYQIESNLRRWHISVIKLGFACAVGLAALSGVSYSEMQGLKSVA